MIPKISKFGMSARTLLYLMTAALAAVPAKNLQASATVIADQPIFVTNNVPPNMMLALSVEWPTGVVEAYKDYSAYTPNNRYIGYFYPEFCYKYYQANGATVYNAPDAPVTTPTGRNAAAAAQEYFIPTANGSGTNNRECDGTTFSGNFLNWATAHALDEFRFIMTGGDRVIDTATQTVVEKSRQTGQGGYGQFRIRTINSSTTISKATPFGWSKISIRIKDGNNELNPWGDSATRGRVIQMRNEINSNTTWPTAGTTTYTFLGRVQMCSTAAPSPGLEYNGTDDYKICQGYPVGSASPTVYKPVGLIQKNSTKMRFGATGYLLHTSQDRAGGVIRARMKSVGPNLVVPDGSTVTNANAEWDANTGVFVTNPDSADATASSTASGSTISNSGVINYLNKFGKLTTSDYKGTDPFSELYYAALRNLRNLDPVPEYVQSMTAAMYEGFPVITDHATEPTGPTYSASDMAPLPIQYSCQQNNIVGIADVNCWTDVFVPGNTLAGVSGGHPYSGLTDPAVGPNALDVTALGDAIGAMEFNPAQTLGTTYASGSRKNTYHLASLAYWANTKDILTDDASKPWTQGKQIAKSYFVDVRESGSGGTINTQMWLAAKYGGFEDRNNNGIPATRDTWNTNNDTCATDSSLCNHSSTFTTRNDQPTVHVDGARPDNFFTGNNPDKLYSSLSSIFNNVLSRSLSGAGASISTINFQSSTANGAYTVQYNAKEWTGDVKGNQITVDNTGTPSVINIWSTQSKLDGLVSNAGANDGWDTQRKIVTWNTGASPGGVTFRHASLDSTQQAYLGTTSADQQKLLNYLRGQKCHELGNTFSTGCSSHDNLYRVRTHILGDIISSEATVVGYPEAPYANLPGYTAFKTQYSTTTPRKRMLYVGANDGMVHAIDADVGSAGPPVVATGSTAGQELWAYVPSFMLPGPSSPATPNVDGLAARAKATGFVHKYYVDATPFARDIDFKDTKSSTDVSNTWRTILVGGLGKGGRGYYAIDITNPADWTSESAVAGKVLWEFSDEDLGYSFARPVIVRTERDGWVVIVASGYNNTLGSVTANQGKGFLYILNAKTGALIEKISTSTGSASDPSGFAHPAAFLPDSSTFITDYVYGADLKGNLWRFDLRGTSTTYSSPTKIAELTDGAMSPAGQPVTIEPKIEIGSNGIDRWVFVGTGQLLDSSDMSNSQQQTFYAIKDGTRTQAYGSGTGQRSLPSSTSHPISRSNLIEVTNLLDGYLPDASKPMGWFYNLHSSEKITTPLVANEGLISWNGYTPTTDACAPGAASNLYVTDYDTGVSRLSISGTAVQYYQSSSYLVKLQFVKDSSGKIRAIITTGDPTGGNQISKLEGRFGRASGTPVRVNWREILD